MTTTLSHAAPIAACGIGAAGRAGNVPIAGEPVVDLGARDASRASRHQGVDALVTIAVMAWVVTALVRMAGEV